MKLQTLLRDTFFENPSFDLPLEIYGETWSFYFSAGGWLSLVGYQVNS